MLTTRKTCRACGSSALEPVISLGNQFLASNFQMSEKFLPVGREIPLDLVRCDPHRDENACGLVQLKHTVPPSLMYSSYGYRSGVNDTMRRHLGEIAEYAHSKGHIESGDLVVDIGANDGTLLAHYQNILAARGGKFIGFEPSDVTPEKPIPGVVIVRDFFSTESLRNQLKKADTINCTFGFQKAKIITSIAMFYDLEDPNQFVSDISISLAHDGIWIFEMSYLPSMLKNASFDTICHEHLEYYALAPIERLLNKHGLVLADVSLNDANGGSIRVTACQAGGEHAQLSEEVRARIYAIQKHEFELALDSPVPYLLFKDNVEKIRAELAGLLTGLASQGKRVYGYGASTKGNVILQYCGITPSHLLGIADRNPAKVGGRTIGTGIPIISEEEMRAAKPDYLLVLPWHFLKEFRSREGDFRARGGKFIVSVPCVEIL